jgi:hypothetical protein
MVFTSYETFRELRLLEVVDAQLTKASGECADTAPRLASFRRGGVKEVFIPWKGHR